MSTLTLPSYWKRMPEWFRGNEWVVQNQNLPFLHRLANTVSQLQDDVSIKSPGQKPMEATKECLMGEDCAKTTQHQYRETLKELAKMDAEDKVYTDILMASFKTEFKDYLPFLEEGL